VSQFENVSVMKKANVYSDGKCVSHTLRFADGTRKSVGVMFPSSLQFTTGAAEILDVLDGECCVRLAGQSEFVAYHGGQSFNVPANTAFEIEVLTTLHYVCHFV